MKQLYGVTTAMITAFNADGEVDEKALEQLTEFLIGQRINALYPCGTTGEMLKLKEEERKLAAETVVRQAKGRVPVYIHVGASTTEETIRLAVHAKEAGADGVGVVTPQFFKATDEEMEAYYCSVAKAVEGFPVYLYNIPQCTGNDLTAAVCEQIAEKCPNVVGIKYSYGDMARMVEYLKIRDWRFSVLHGMDKIFSGLLVLGCDGTVSGCAGVFPEPYVKVYEAYLRRDFQGMKKYQKAAAEIGDALKNGSNMSYFKEALRMRGIPVGGMRLPQKNIGREEIEKLEQQLRKICADYGMTFEVSGGGNTL